MKKRKDTMTITKMETIKTVRVTFEIEDEVYHALAEAGRLHVNDDKQACFSYAINAALKELAERTK